MICKDIGMELRSKKCDMQSRVIGWFHPTVKEFNDVEIRIFGYFCDKIMENEMKREYLRRTLLIMRSRLNGMNKARAMNT